MSDARAADPESILAVARRTLLIEAEAVHRLAGRLDAAFVRAVELLERCRARVVVTGIGKSGLVARKVAATLAATGTPALFLHPAEGAHGDLGMLAAGDVVVALSNSGETDEVLALLPAIKRLALPLVALTGRPDSRLARLADVALDCSVALEACPLNVTPTASSTATLALGDALALAVLTRRGLGPDDLAHRHPGGAFARRLIRVEDLLHRGAEIPQVREDAPLTDVVREMTAKRLGCTAVVDARGVLVGVVTDGDLRRRVARDAGMPAGDLLAGSLMTRGPRTIEAAALAAAALELMERHAITQLLVVDPVGRPEGILHLHDLLRAKVV
jgi:arabinose-5-phosphate isomerase